MKKIYKKWDNLNIKYKLFSITTCLLVLLAIIIYLILYFLLPSYYHKYKIDLLEKSVRSLTENSINYSTDFLAERLFYMEKSQNLSILLKNQDGIMIYGKKDTLILRYNKYILNRHTEDYILKTNIFTRDSNGPYTLDIIMPLQPINEASKVIRDLMPYIIIIAILIGILGAYIYSNTITKPLLDIIEKEREAESRRKDFVATISHELKTPITIISGQLEGMMYNIGKYKDRDTYIKKSYDCTQELKDLVNEMMEVSKAEILEKDLNLKQTNISELLNKLAKRQAFLIEEKNMKIDLQIEENIFIECDEERISKAINNIINNAIKYSPDNESIIIRLYNKRSKKNDIKIIYLEIENTGVNIDKKYLKDIFKPFFRIEKSRSRKTGGSGLGLYLVSQILTSHGFNHNLVNKDNSVLFIIEF